MDVNMCTNGKVELKPNCANMKAELKPSCGDVGRAEAQLHSHDFLQIWKTRLDRSKDQLKYKQLGRATAQLGTHFCSLS